MAVVDRPAGEGTIASLVYPDVVAGDYELVPKDGGPVRLRVHVEGGCRDDRRLGAGGVTPG